MKKYIIRLMVVLTLLLGLGVVTYADDLAELTLIRGTLVKVGKNNVTVKNETQTKIPVDKEAIIVDAMSLKGITLKDLLPNQAIELYVDEDGEAEVVVGNIPQDTMAPRLVKVQQIEQTGCDTGRMLVDNGSLWITVGENTSINKYIPAGMTGATSTAKLSEIRVGQDLLVVYGPVATSYPGQTTAEKVLILPYED